MLSFSLPVPGGMGGVAMSRGERVKLIRSGSMKSFRGWRMLVAIASGTALLQAGGCTFADFNELAQTILLGVTAAGSIAILQNI